MNIDKIVTELRDRFTTWETILGIGMIAAGYFIYVYPQYLVNIAIPVIFVFNGLKGLFENKYRRQHKIDERVKTYRDQ